MSTNTIFHGAATALITPFKDGKVDYDCLKRLIDWQIEEGIDAIVGRAAGVGGLAMEADLHGDAGSHTVTGRDTHSAGVDRGLTVGTDDAGNAIHHAVVHHHLGAADRALLAGLEHKPHIALQLILVFLQVLGNGQHNGSV